MAYEFVLPDLGEGIAEGEIIKWLVRVGDHVEEDQTLVEIETDKAAVEIPSPREGYILELRGEEGDLVKVGEILLVIGEEKAQAVAPAISGKKKAAKSKKSGPEGGKTDVKEQKVARGSAPPSAGPILATPSTRKLARELGVDLSTVRGTGKDGRISADDVRVAKEASAGKPGLPAATSQVEGGAVSEPGPEETIPVRSLRRKIAQKMIESWRTIPHVTHVEEVEVTSLVRLRAEMNSVMEEEGVKLTYLPFILKAIVPALRRFPQFNAVFDETAEEVILKRYYNIGIATATEAGLMVPVVKAVDEKNITDLSREITKLSEEARTRKIALDDLKHGTFSVTNYGSIGGLFGTPIINHPEVAILGIGRIQKRPVVSGDEIKAAHILYFSLSFDHRIADGKDAAEFVNAIRKYLENPNLLFLEMA